MTNRKDIKKALNNVHLTSITNLMDMVRDFMSCIGDIPLWRDTDIMIENYALMMKYMREGHKDTSRRRVLHDMKQRCYQIISDSLVWDDRKNNAIISKAWNIAHKNSTRLELENITFCLEKYTSDVTMTELMPEDQRINLINKIEDEHYTYTYILFCHLVSSTQWAKGEAETYTNLLTKPTISPEDQALMVSAITISAFEYFDINKSTTLLDVYLCLDADMVVRQRALVGFVLSLKEEIGIFRHEQQNLVKRLLEADENTMAELLDLQKQIISCIDVKNDSEKMSKDIIPTLIKNNPDLTITSEGIKEKDLNSNSDVFDPEANEKEMEKLEESMDEMLKMMDNGSDIYFSGFAQMKRFPFFSNISNWFRIFNPSHPMMRNLPEEVRDSEVVKSMNLHMPFCNSDKYSFAIMLAHTISSIPHNVRNMMLEGQMSINGFSNSKMLRSPMFIRRSYLQDMYRFYRLYPELGNNLEDIFCKDMITKVGIEFPDMSIPQRCSTLFLAGDFFLGTDMNETLFNIIIFLKNKGTRFDEAIELLVSHLNQNTLTIEQQHFVITEEMKRTNPMDNIATHGKLLMLHNRFPEDKWYTKNLAKLEFKMGEYQLAYKHFTEILNPEEQDVTLLINIATCCMNAGNEEEAYKILLPLTFSCEDNPKIERAMAWCNLLTGKIAEAYSYYQKFYNYVETDSLDSNDILNAGYAAWIAGHMNEAIKMFLIFVAREGEEALWDDLSNATVLINNGIYLEDCELMLDIIREA